MSDVIQIEGFEELLKALKEAPERVLPFVRKAMRASVLAVQARISEYPPSTEANRPGRIDKAGRPMGYYERGRGWWYPVMRRKTLGDEIGVGFGAETAKRAAGRVKMKGIPTVAGYKLAQGGTSEMLGRSWAAEVYDVEGGVMGVVGNNASYADYVQGSRQAEKMRSIGWMEASAALQEAMPEIEEAFGEAVEGFMESW